MSPFILDGVSYNVRIPENGIKRSGQVTDGSNAGRNISGAMIRDIIGTFYNYTISIEADDTDLEEYDNLFETLSAPVSDHTLTVPYGQETLTFQAYITDVSDTLEHIDEHGNHWGSLTLNFIAMKPQRRP